MIHPLLYDPAHLAVARQTLAELEAAPNRTLGQNFLVNGGALDKIVAASGVKDQDAVLEIGPGLGALSVRLLRAGAHLTAIEKDRKFAAFLQKQLGEASFSLHEADALEVNWEELALPNSGVKLVANLPYSISKPILRRMLEDWRPHLLDLTVLVQREVADRLVADPGTREYGPLSIMANMWGRPKKCFDISPGSFFPPPNVISTVVHIPLRQEPAVPINNEPGLWKVVRAAFGQRRKQLRNTLAGLADKATLEAALEAASIDPQRRGETLTLAEFALLADCLFAPTTALAATPQEGLT